MTPGHPTLRTVDPDYGDESAVRLACLVEGCGRLTANGEARKRWCPEHVLTHSPYVQEVLAVIAVEESSGRSDAIGRLSRQHGLSRGEAERVLIALQAQGRVSLCVTDEGDLCAELVTQRASA